MSKKIKISYWVSTGMFSAFIIMSAIPDIFSSPQAVAVFQHLGYPIYLLPFIGIAKFLGILAVLVPGFPWIKEWAYAGLLFDLLGAMYSSIALDDPAIAIAPAVIGLVLLTGSYFFYHKNLMKNENNKQPASN